MSESLYVCLFSSGHIKVGRSTDPVSRIASHADRVACLGVEMVEKYVVACAGAAGPSELELIGLCAAAPGATRYQSEWFSGLEFEVVCGWARACAAREHEQPPVTALRRYLDSLPQGGMTKFANDLGIGKAYLSQLAAGWRGCEPNAKLCVLIEQLSGGRVTRRDLRRKWRDIWPELA